MISKHTRTKIAKQPNYPIATVVTLCGYESDAFAKKLFKRATGLTMRAWRCENRTQLAELADHDQERSAAMPRCGEPRN